MTSEERQSPYIKVDGQKSVTLSSDDKGASAGVSRLSHHDSQIKTAISPYEKMKSKKPLDYKRLKLSPGNNKLKLADYKKLKLANYKKLKLPDYNKLKPGQLEDMLLDLGFSIAVLERVEPGDGQYGWGSFRPPWLQTLCNPRYLLFSLSMIGIVQGFFAHGVLASNLQPLHRRFGLTMLNIGVIRMMYDLGMLLAFIPVMYFNAQGVNRPRWLAVSCLVMAAGAAIYTMPHFIMGLYSPADIKKQSCDMPMTTPNGSSLAFSTSNFHTTPQPMSCSQEQLSGYAFVFMFGVFLFGLGSAPYFTMGIAFMDENISQRSSVVYTGILNALMLAGSAAGFFVNAYGANYIYVDYDKDSVEKMDMDGPGWVWAWWCGSLITMLLSVVVSIPISGFPNRLPDSVKAHMEDAILSENDDEEAAGEPQTTWQSVKACLSNVTYVGLVIEQIAYVMLITGFASFIPVYLRSVYGNPYDESRAIGGGIVICAMVGAIVGALLHYQLKLNTRIILRFSLGTAIVSFIFTLVVLFKCKHMDLVGSTANYPVAGHWNISAASRSLHALCNSHCGNCSRDDYEPVCAKVYDIEARVKKFYTYYSPCFAGCSRNEKEVFNCQCVPYDGLIGSQGGGSLLRTTRCISKECTSRGYVFLIGFCWVALLFFARLNPMQQCLLRSIPVQDRLVGLTLSALVSRALGAIPGPMVMGVIADESCVLKGHVCGNDHYCAWRAEDFLTNWASSIGISVSLLGILGLIVANVGHHMKTTKNKSARSFLAKSKLQKEKLAEKPATGNGLERKANRFK